MAEEEWETIAVGPSAGSSDDEWETVAVGPEAPPPEPQGWGELIGKSLIKGTTAIPEGFGYLGAWLGDKATDAINSYADPMGMRGITTREQAEQALATGKLPDPSSTYLRDAVTPVIQSVDQYRRENIGDPLPIGAKQRFASKVAGYLPGALIPGGTLGTRVASAVGSGVGAFGADELGLPEWAGALPGAIVPGMAYSLGKKVLSPVRVAAGNDLLRNAGAEGRDNLARALAGEVDDALPLTYAEMADTPSAASFQVHMRGDPGEGTNALEAMLAGRQDTRRSLIQEIAPDALDDVAPNVRGALIQPEAAKIAKAAREAASAEYDKLKLEGLIDIKPAQVSTVDIADDIFGKSKLSPDFEAKAVFQGIIDDPSKVSLDDLRIMRRDIRAVTDKIYRQNESALELPVLKELKKALDNAQEAAITNGTLSEADSKALAAASAGWQKMKDTFQSDLVKDITKRGRTTGGFDLSNEATPAVITRNQESAAQYMKAFSDKPELVTQARGAAIDKVFKAKDYKAWVKAYDKEKPMLKEFFKGDADKLERVVNSIRSELGVDELAARASKGRSYTTQGLTVANRFISEGPRKLLRLIGSKIGLGGSAVMAGPYGVAATGTAIGVSSLANKVEGLIRDQVLRGMADPETLKMLANTATDAQMKIAYERLLPAVITSMRSQMDSPSPSEGQISPPEELSLETSSPKATTPTPTSKAKQFTSTDPVDIAVEEAIRMKDGEAPLPQADETTRLLKAVSLQESSGNPNVVHPMTPRGERAQGLHGVLPSTAKDIAKELGIAKYDLKDPETNRIFAEHYLKQMIEMFDGNVELGLAAYHSGPNRIKTLLKLHNGKTLADIRQHLGPVGKQYASGVLSKLKKIDKYGSVKT